MVFALKLYLKGDERVLDVATGTGLVAFAIAKELPDGTVTGIDFSEGMLAQATKNKIEKGTHNVTFAEMDMQAIEFEDNYFNVAISAFSIFFVEDMKEQLIHIAKKVKDGGTILMTTFFDNSFAPLVGLLLNRLDKYGIEMPSLAWKRVATTEQCTSLFTEAGLMNIKSEQKECGYYLRDPADWWYIVWNGGFRGLASQLSKDDFIKFREEHLAEVKELESDKGIWLDIGVLYTTGQK